MMHINKNQTGFTIIELMIATTIFSMVLLLCAMAIVHVGNMYYKGTLINRTQDMSRKVVDDVTRSIQFGNASTNPLLFYRPGTASFGGFTVNSICLGSVRYSFSQTASQGTAAGQIRHAMWRDRTPDDNCAPRNLTAVTPSADGESMLGDNMRVPSFTVTPSSNLWDIDLVISYGDDPNLFEPASNFSICKGTSAGGQFCAASSFSTSVVKRL